MPRAQDYVINTRGNTQPVAALLAGSRLKAEKQSREKNAFILSQEQEQAERDAQRRKSFSTSGTTNDYRSSLRDAGDIEGYKNSMAMAETEREFKQKVKTDQFKAGMLSWHMGKYKEAGNAWANLWPEIDPASVGKTKDGLISFTDPKTGRKRWADPTKLSQLAGISKAGTSGKSMTFEQRKELETHKQGLKKTPTDTSSKDRQKMIDTLAQKLADGMRADQESANIRPRDTDKYRNATQRQEDAIREATRMVDQMLNPPEPTAAMEPPPANALAAPAAAPAPQGGRAPGLGGVWEGRLAPRSGQAQVARPPAPPPSAARGVPAAPQAPMAPAAPVPPAARGAAGAPPSGLPPGARQAPDGNWYVQQNGQWYRIDQ